MPLLSAYCAHQGYHPRAALGLGSPTSATRAVARTNNIRFIVVPPRGRNFQHSVGRPAAFQALIPPARCPLCGKPAAWAISAALIERIPDAQENTSARAPGSG